MCVTTMPKRTDICSDLREAVVATLQSGKGYKTNYLESIIQRKIIHKWKTFKTSVNLPGIPVSSPHCQTTAMFKGTAKKKKNKGYISVTMLNVDDLGLFYSHGTWAHCSHYKVF